MKKVLAVLLVLVMVVACFTGCGNNAQSDAENWPSKTVTFIVPFAAGGSTDIIFRALADKLTEDLGQTFIVENKEGGSGSLGLAEAAIAEPDGYTFSIGMGSNMCMVPNMSNTGYDAFDFTPVCQVTNTPVVLAVNKNLPVNNLEEFIEYAKNNNVTWSSSGANNTQQVVMTLLGDQEGFTTTPVPQDGAPAAIAACMGGHVDAAVAVATDFTSAYASKEVKFICVFDDQRVDFFPDVPCTKELGYDNLSYGVWYSLVGPLGLDEAIVNKLAEATKAAMESDYLVDAYAKMNVMTQYLSPEELAAKIKEFDAVMDEVMANW